MKVKNFELTYKLINSPTSNIQLIMSSIQYSLPDLEKYIKFRQDLHRIPEMGFEEAETKRYLLDYINKLDIFSKGAKITETAKTGFFIDFPGKAEKQSDLITTIAYRTDLDGLPITEETGLPYSSIHHNRQHACGHDGHMTILVAFLEFYANNIERIPANVNLRFIFQPAEEGLGGASAMIEGKCLEKVQEIYGLHNSTFFNLGEIGLAEGTIMARMDKFEVRIHAKGGNLFFLIFFQLNYMRNLIIDHNYRHFSNNQLTSNLISLKIYIIRTRIYSSFMP